MKLTKEQTIEEHHKMWNWIAENVHDIRPTTAKQIKEYYLKNISCLKETTDNNCFCPEYINELCYNCSLYWGAKPYRCVIDNCVFYIEFSKYIRCADYVKAADMAKLIANLPKRKDDNNGINQRTGYRRTQKNVELDFREY